MKKPRFQPSFASLSEDELEQLACMTQRETFAVVLERVRKPRSEGGFGLTFRSESPLERLLDKKNKLDLINAQIANGKKLTLADLNTFISGGTGPCDNHSEHRAPEEVHDAIMSATYILVTEHDNTPHQLLALQRLADFPTRAEIRAAKEQRAEEMHTHKINLDLRKFEHKIEMDTFHQHITTERLALQKRSLALREKQHQDRPSSPSPLRGERVGVRGSSTSDDSLPSRPSLPSLPS